jgi:glycosyltransferase involved in cell wall biosynthesis
MPVEVSGGEPLAVSRLVEAVEARDERSTPAPAGPSPRRTIRVLHVSQSTVAGVETHILQILGHIDRGRFESHLVCPPGSPLARHAHALGASVVPVALTRDPSPLADVRAVAAVRSVIRSGRFDIVHTHSSKGGFIGRLAARLAGHRRVVHTPNAFYYIGHRGLKRAAYRSLERAARPWTDRLIATSASEQHSAIADLGFSPAAVRQINNAIELPERAPRNGGATESSVLFAGRFGHQKNPEMFVRVSALLARRFPATRFTMIGVVDGDPYARHIESMIADLGLTDRYRLVGWLEREETLRHIAESTVFVIPSRYEGCCYIAAEAMALGVPVVATDVAGLREVVEDGQSGYLVPLDDDEAAAERIARLLSDPALRCRTGERGIERVDRLFNVETNIKLLERAYLELLGEIA